MEYVILKCGELNIVVTLMQNFMSLSQFKWNIYLWSVPTDMWIPFFHILHLHSYSNPSMVSLNVWLLSDFCLNSLSIMVVWFKILIDFKVKSQFCDKIIILSILINLIFCFIIIYLERWNITAVFIIENSLFQKSNDDWNLGISWSLCAISD